MALVSVFCSTGDRLMELSVLWFTPETEPQPQQESIDLGLLGVDLLRAVRIRQRRTSKLGEYTAPEVFHQVPVLVAVLHLFAASLMALPSGTPSSCSKCRCSA